MFTDWAVGLPEVPPGTMAETVLPTATLASVADAGGAVIRVVVAMRMVSVVPSRSLSVMLEEVLAVTWPKTEEMRGAVFCVGTGACDAGKRAITRPPQKPTIRTTTAAQALLFIK
jgi:hypothetical protein